MIIFRSFALLLVSCFGLIAAQTVTVTVNTCSASTVTTTVTYTPPPPLTSCQAGYQAISNPDFETIPLSSTWGTDMTISSIASCGQQGTTSAPGRCAGLKPIGNGVSTITQALSNLCPGKTYQIRFSIGLPKTVFSLSAGTRLPVFKVGFSGLTLAQATQPVCSSSNGIGTNPCTKNDIYGTYAFRTVSLPVTPPVSGASGSLSITIQDDLVANVVVALDTISVTVL